MDIYFIFGVGLGYVLYLLASEIFQEIKAREANKQYWKEREAKELAKLNEKSRFFEKNGFENEELISSCSESNSSLSAK